MLQNNRLTLNWSEKSIRDLQNMVCIAASARYQQHQQTSKNILLLKDQRQWITITVISYQLIYGNLTSRNWRTAITHLENVRSGNYSLNDIPDVNYSPQECRRRLLNNSRLSRRRLLTSTITGLRLLGSRMSGTLLTHPKECRVRRLLTSRLSGKAISRLKDAVDGNYRTVLISRMSGTSIIYLKNVGDGNYVVR